MQDYNRFSMGGDQSAQDVLHVLSTANEKASKGEKVYLLVNKRGVLTYTGVKKESGNVKEIRAFVLNKFLESQKNGDISTAILLQENLLSIEKKNYFKNVKLGNMIEHRKAVNQIQSLQKQLIPRKTPDPPLTASGSKSSTTDSAVLTPRVKKIAKMTDISTVHNIDDKIDLLRRFSNDVINLSHDTLDYSTFEELKKNKKEAKNLLSRPELSNKQKVEINQVISEYHVLVESHQVLKELRALSRYIKEVDFSDEGSKSFRLFESMLKDEGLSTEDISQLLTAGRIKELRKHYFDAAQPAVSFIMSKHNITWISGSRSAAIPMIERVRETILSKAPALVPTGQLLKHNLVPLTGELGTGITSRGINQEYLSGVALQDMETAMSYAKSQSFIFDPVKEINIIMGSDFTKNQDANRMNRLQIALLRLSLMNYDYDKELHDHIENKILEPLGKIKNEAVKTNFDTELPWKGRAQLVGRKVSNELKEYPVKADSESYVRGQVVQVNEEYGLIVGVNPVKVMLGEGKIFEEDELDEKEWFIEPLDEKAIEEEARAYAPLDKEILGRLSDVMDNIKALEKIDAMTPQERIKVAMSQKPLDMTVGRKKLIAESFPIIWASCTVKPIPFKYGVSREGVIKGTAELGKDIQVVFTDQDHVKELSEAVSQYGVTVLSFSTARYLVENRALLTVA